MARSGSIHAPCVNVASVTSPFTYDFGYPWLLIWFHAIPIVVGLIAFGLGLKLGWRRWKVALWGVVAAWGVVGFFLTHTMMGGLNAPQRLPSERFLASGEGRVLDVGAGSGRALIGLLLARPRATGTALDIYSGFFGVVDNTPERTMRNAAIAGVANRASTITADATKMPIADASYDAAISSYAIDHMGRDGTPKALKEVARILKPNGEFLLQIVNPDIWSMVMMPIPHVGVGAHRRPDPVRWRAMLTDAGFEILEEGTAPATRYWLARKAPGTGLDSGRNQGLHQAVQHRVPDAEPRLR
jgi:SAM-dependent methyltransferase